MTVTVSSILFGHEDPARALAAVPGWRAATSGLAAGLTTLNPAGRGVVERELAGAVAGLLGLNLGDVLVAAWRKHRALYAAAVSTQDSPGTEVVQLATHRVSTTHRPSVDVTVNGARLTTVHCELSLVLDIETLTATVRRARLVALGGGRCSVTGVLAFAGQPLVSRQTPIDLSLTVSLGQGIPLLEQVEATG
jgi:hypothetical protein